MAECRDCLAAREQEPAFRDGHSAYCEGHRQARKRHNGKYRALKARLRTNGVEEKDLPKTPRYKPQPLDDIEHPVRDRRVLAEDAEYLIDLIRQTAMHHVGVSNALAIGTNPDRQSLLNLDRSLGNLLPELGRYLSPYDPPRHPRAKPPSTELD